MKSSNITTCIKFIEKRSGGQLCKTSDNLAFHDYIHYSTEEKSMFSKNSPLNIQISSGTIKEYTIEEIEILPMETEIFTLTDETIGEEYKYNFVVKLYLEPNNGVLHFQTH